MSRRASSRTAANKALYDDQHRIYRGLYEAIANAGQYQALADFVAKYY